MKNVTIKGETAVLEVLGEIQQLIATKEEYIFEDDISTALLVHAISYIYESLEEESEASHMIMLTISEVLSGGYYYSSANHRNDSSYLKH